MAATPLMDFAQASTFERYQRIDWITALRVEGVPHTSGLWPLLIPSIPLILVRQRK